MPVPPTVGTRTVDNPLALRAFAHPLRRKLYGLIAREGTLTSADASRLLNISHGLASHHIRQLAKYGFVEAAGTTDARAHPWRVTSTSFRIEATDPDSRAPADLLEQHTVEQAAHDLSDWQNRRQNEDERWHALPGTRESLLYLTPDELRDVLDQWTRIVEPLANRRPIGHHDRRPDDAAPIAFTLVAVPLQRTEHGG
ncbi:MAG: putative transcriptional regulator [Frondihabitans sp.]|nr:putative transcriptional regulator [Frondihabitans sp.]